MSFTRKKKEIEPSKALMRLEELCARSEQCEYELRRKLTAWGVTGDDADVVMRSLERRRFVDDRRFAAAYVRDKYRFGRWGRRKIVIGLRQKRIDSDIINEALDEIDAGEYLEILSHVVAAKARTMEETESFEARSRLLRFGVARGYEPDLVLGVIKNLTSQS